MAVYCEEEDLKRNRKRGWLDTQKPLTNVRIGWISPTEERDHLNIEKLTHKQVPCWVWYYYRVSGTGVYRVSGTDVYRVSGTGVYRVSQIIVKVCQISKLILSMNQLIAPIRSI